ncbi:MAG: hypothetical protein MZU95_07855 [Desulfomicrobium escambiense]|nr:hypothetical protein [Desulfomicrobium escambiense]
MLLEQMHFPEPVISVAIEPKTLSDRDKLKETLDILSMEDPTFTDRENEETGQLIIQGMGELHLDVLVTRIIRDFKVGAKVGNPQVTVPRVRLPRRWSTPRNYARSLAGKEIRRPASPCAVEPLARGDGQPLPQGHARPQGARTRSTRPWSGR